MQVRRNHYYTNYLLILICCFTFAAFSEAFAQSDNAAQGASGNQINTVEIPTDEATVAQGRTLFGQHCTVCHQVEQQIIGPALASVHQRRPLPWLIKFIQNSQDVINSGNDEYAIQLFEQYNRVVMPNFEFLSNDDIISILAYIKAESSSETSSGGVNGASSANNQDEETSQEDDSEVYSQRDGESNSEGYAQQDEQDGEGETSDNVSSGLSSGMLFGVLIGMLILIGIIFMVAKRSGKSKQRR